jgi:hypothetical protein
MNTDTTVQPLEKILAASAATESFKQAVQALSAGRAHDCIKANAGAPPVKVLRVVTKLLEACPETPIEGVRIEAFTGCSNFTGEATVTPGDIQINFDWDCRWKAHQLGWQDAFGDPDQIRAAREMGYQCFKSFSVEGEGEVSA